MIRFHLLREAVEQAIGVEVAIAGVTRLKRTGACPILTAPLLSWGCHMWEDHLRRLNR